MYDYIYILECAFSSLAMASPADDTRSSDRLMISTTFSSWILRIDAPMAIQSVSRVVHPVAESVSAPTPDSPYQEVRIGIRHANVEEARVGKRKLEGLAARLHRRVDELEVLDPHAIAAGQDGEVKLLQRVWVRHENGLKGSRVGGALAMADFANQFLPMETDSP